MADIDEVSRLATLAKFYLGCVEAEQAAALAVRIGSDYLEAGAGFIEEGSSVPIPHSLGTSKWCAKRMRDDPRGLVTLGWPLCLGSDPQSREKTLSPLLVGEARILEASEGGWRCERAGGGVDLNSAALGLLGFSNEDRMAIETAMAKSVAVDEAKGRRERARAILRELVEHGVEGLEDIGASPPVRIDGHRRDGVVNAAVLLPPATNTALILNLAKDLRELAAGAGDLSKRRRWGGAFRRTPGFKLAPIALIWRSGTAVRWWTSNATARLFTAMMSGTPSGTGRCGGWVGPWSGSVGDASSSGSTSACGM